jgi:hypothetical protein
MGESTEQSSDFDRIVIGGTDSANRTIVDVYANQAGRYAVYQTADRVVVLYADDPQLQRIQRRNLAPLAKTRAEVNGALASWREANRMFRLRDASRRCDMMVASALIEALEGQPEAGAEIMMSVASEIRAERSSRARIYYMLCTLIVAAGFSIVCLFGLGILPKGEVASAATDSAATALWYSVVAGVLGSVYSMALGIDRRDVTNDRRWADHLTDALVRICIGALAAFVFGNFLLTKAVQINFGPIGALPNGAGGPTWHVLMIAGFLAGFAERLVPDLLNSYSLSRAVVPPANLPKPPAAPAHPPGDPKAKTGGAPAASPETEDELVETRSDEEDVDGCDVDLADEAASTRDEDLPAASGGVARS